MANRFARYVEQAPANRFAKYSQPEQDEPARTPDTSFFREPVSVGGRVGVGGEPVLNSVGAFGDTPEPARRDNSEDLWGGTHEEWLARKQKADAELAQSIADSESGRIGGRRANEFWRQTNALNERGLRRGEFDAATAVEAARGGAEEMAGGILESIGDAARPFTQMFNVGAGLASGDFSGVEDETAYSEAGRGIAESGRIRASDARLAMIERPRSLLSVDGLRFAAQEAIASGAPTALGLAAGIASPRIGLGAIGASAAGTEYSQSRAEGQSPLDAATDAAFKAATEAVPEALPLGVLTGRLGKFATSVGGDTLKRIYSSPVGRQALMAGAEGMSEVTTELANIGYERAVEGKNISDEDAFKRITDAFAIGTVMGGGMGAASEAVGYGGRAAARVQRDVAEIERRQLVSDISARILGRTTPPQTPQEAQTDAGAGIAEAAIQNALAARPVQPAQISPVATNDMRENDELDRLLVGALGQTDEQTGTVAAAGQSQVTRGQSPVDTTQPTQAEAAVDVAPPKPRNYRDTQFDERKHDLLDFIAMNGGLDRAAAESEGVDPAVWKAKSAENDRFFGKPAFKKGGMSIETLREKLAQSNFAPIAQSRDALDLVFDALGGREVVTPDGATWRQQQRERDENERIQRALSDLPAGMRSAAEQAQMQSAIPDGDVESLALAQQADRDQVRDDILSALPSVQDQSPAQRVSAQSLGADYTDRLLSLMGARKSGAMTEAEREEYTALLEQDRETGKVGGRPMVGIGNKTAYVDALMQGKLMPVQVFLDADNFKALNDKFGHDVGDDAIRLIADVVRAEFGDGNVFHRGGDEFLTQGMTQEEVDAKMARVQDYLARVKMELPLSDGRTATLTGVGVSYGTGANEKAADDSLKQDKQRRKDAGLRFDRREGDDAWRVGSESAGAGTETGRTDSRDSSRAAAEGVGDVRTTRQADAGGVGARGDSGNQAQPESSDAQSAGRADGVAGLTESTRTEQAESGLTVAEFNAELARAYDPRFPSRLARISIIAPTWRDVPQKYRDEVKADGADIRLVAGFVASDGTIVLIPGNMQRGEGVGVTIHEVGVHAWMAKNPAFRELLSDFKAARSRIPAVEAAFRRAESVADRDKNGNLTAAAKATLDEEAFAYYVEQNWNAKSPLMTRIKDAIARLLNRLGIPTSGITDALMRQALDGMVQAARESADAATRGAVTVRDGKIVYHKAWHGSPHDFDQFRLDDSTIGTGEGAQAFGHGLYFAGKRELGEYYREVLSENEPNTYTVDGVVQFTGAANPKDPRETAIYYLAMGADPGKISSVFGRPGSDENAAFVAALSALSGKKVERIEGRKGGRLYEVELAPSEDDYLDWDKPLSEQSEKVREGVRQAIRVGAATVTRGDGDRPFSVSIDGKTLHRYKSEVDALEYADELNEVSASEARIQMDSESATTGEQAYRAISESKGGDRQASAALHAAGIPGIRYLDGSSRGGKTGWRVKFKNGQYSGKVFDTKAEADAAVERGEYNMVDRVEKIDDLSHNFVIFDDSQVEVKAKYSRRVQDGRIRKTVAELTNAADSMGSWRDWYDRHDQTLRDVFGDDAELFQKLLSATSQAASVPANVGLALKAYRQLFSGEPFTGYLPAVIKNLDRVAASEALRGQKISEYGSASEGNAGAIAVDRHIAMLFFGTKSPNRKQVASAKNRIRAIAERLGWQPREVQAALWAYNQTLLGTAPEDVKSYDKLIEAARARIDALRASIGRGEDRGAREVSGTAGRDGSAERDTETGREQASAEVGPKYSRRADGGSVGGMDGKTEEYPILPAGILSQEQMLARGAGGHLSRAFERYIEVAKIDGREPTPGASDDIGYVKGRFIADPIEVEYDSSEDRYVLYAGNHRVTQAEVNGDKFIRAFVQPDRGRIGKDSTTLPSKAGLTAGTRYQDSRQAPPREGLGASGPRYSRRTRRADGGSVGGVGDPIKSLQADLARAEAKFEPLRKRRIYDGPEWDAVEQEASRIRKELYRLTGDAYGNQPKKRQARPSDAALNAEYPSPEDVPPEVLQFEQSRSALIADATDAQRWARIVDTLRDDRLAAGPVTLYRAVMGSDDIRPGDWVTTDREYAEEHNRRWFDGRGNIVEMEVDGRDVLASPTGNYEEAVFAPRSLSGPVKDSRQAPPREGLGASGPRYSRSTITVDGVERPTADSTGKAIHPTEEGVRNFWRWFGSSRVVDDRGRPLVVFHGTAYDFDNFDADRNRTELNDKYQGDGFHFSPDPQIASRYADANRNQLLRKRDIYPLVDQRFPGRVAQLFRDVVEQGYEKAWDVSDKEISAIMQAGRDAGVDLNDLLDLAEIVEGSKYHAGRESTSDPGEVFAALFGGSGGRLLSEFHVDDMVKMGLDAAAPAQNVMPVYLKSDNPLVTDSRKKAKSAKRNGYDGVLYSGPDLVGGVSEWVVFDPAQIKSATGNSGAFSPTDKRIAYSRRTPQQAQAESAQKQAELARGVGAVPGQTFAAQDRFTDDWKGTLRKAREKIQDKLLSVRDVQEDVEKVRGAVTDAMNVYRRENLMHGRVGQQRDELERTHIKPLLDAMAKAKVAPELLEDYVEARHAEERNKAIAAKQGGMPDAGAGMTTQAAADFLAGNAAGHRSGVTLTPDLTRTLDRLARRVDAITAETRQRLYQSGQITKQQLTELENAYQFYVPLRGKDGEEDAARGGTGKGIDVRGKPIQRALGRGDGNRAVNILAEVVADAERSIITAEKTRVGRTLARLVIENPNPDVWAIEPVKTEQAYSESADEIYMAVKNIDQDPNTIIVKVSGKPYRIYIEDTRIAEALKNLAVEQLPIAVNIMAGINRYFSAVLTRYNPAFVAVNLVRDMLFGMTGLAAEHGAKSAADAAKNYLPAMRAMWREARGTLGNSRMDRFASEFAEAGGKTYFGKLENVPDIAQRIGMEFKTARQIAINERRPLAAIGKLAKDSRMVQAIENANDAVENALRLAAYAARREAGASVEQAAEYAKNITVNFNRRGAYTSWLNALYLFFNASVQGTHRVFRLLKNRKVQAALGGLALAQAVFAMIAMGYDDEDGEPLWDSIPEWEKQRNFIIVYPYINKDGKVRATTFKIQMPYGFNIFPYLGGRTAALANDIGNDKKHAIRDYINDSTAGVLGAMAPLPFGEEGGFKAWLPHWLRLTGMLSENKDDLGMPIRAGEEVDRYDRPRSAKGRDDTSEAFKMLATALNRVGGGDDYNKPMMPWLLDWAPEDLEFIAATAGGGLSGTALKGQRMTEKLIAGVPVNFKDVPILSSFVSNVDQRQATSSRYYERKDEIERQIAQQRDIAKETGNVEDNKLGIRIARNKSGQKIKRGEGYELEGARGSLFATYKEAEKEITRIRDEMRATYRDSSIDFGERARRIDALKVEREEVQREVNAKWREVFGRKSR